VKARGCLTAAAVGLAMVAAAGAVVGPGLLRRARTIYAPISKMKGAQSDFEVWQRARPWQPPAAPALSAEKLDDFLALRKELREMDAAAQSIRQRAPEDRKPKLDEVPAIIDTMGELVTERFQAFRHHDMTPAEFDYLERLVYQKWLGALASQGVDPASRERAAREIDLAAEAERDAVVKARLRKVAASLRERVPAAPEGIPPEVHRLLLAKATEIQAQPVARVSSRVRRAG
jgi:hypothetical protein